MSYATLSDLEARGLLFEWDRANTHLKITVNTVTVCLNSDNLSFMLNFLEGRYPPKKEREAKNETKEKKS